MNSKKNLIIALIILTLAACNLSHPTATVTPIPITNTSIPSPTLTNTPLATSVGTPLTSAPSLLRITFQDASNGWGMIADNGGAILRTLDGGVTWLNVTPPTVTGIGLSTNLSVLDVNTAWVLVPAPDYLTSQIYRTSDGGLTWSFFEAPFVGGFLQFVDANTGFALADLGAGAGSQAVEMFQTTDGGATWLSVFNDDPSRPDSANSLPLSGIKSGMTFLDNHTGWVTGARPVDGEVYLFVTHNGGVDWTEQSIPLPAGFQTFQYLPQAPIFFGNAGYLPLMVDLSNIPVVTFYTTQDGGATWAGDPSNTANQVPLASRYAFADSLHGWAWDGGTHIYFTTNGAQTWSAVPTSLDLGDNLVQIVFVPTSNGQFIGWALTGQDVAGHTQLYQTTDNGSTWTPLVP